jgi:hypothetical protein
MFAELPYPIVPLVVVLHGLGHGGALAALAWIAAAPASNTGAWTAARSWLAPGMDPGAATVAAAAFWLASLVLFLAAGLGMAGIGLVDAWRPLAAAGAVVSLAGIGLFLGTWPAFNTIAAVAVNVGILVLLATSR